MTSQVNNNGNGHSKFLATIVFIVWWCLWNAVHSKLLQDAGLSSSQALTDGGISTLLLAGCCFLIINSMRYYLPKQQRYLYVVVASGVLSGVWLVTTRLTLKTIFKDDTLYQYMLGETTVLRLAFGFLMIMCATLVSMTWYSQKEQQEEQERKADTERLAREAELNTLRQQLQPHFLFNSLNSISALTGQQPEKARHMIQQLSDFLRGTLRNETQQWVSLEEELNYLQLYLDIEKVRFGYRLQSKVEHDDNALKMRLPSMLLQPLVENAIKFGLYDTIGEVEILIKAGNNNGMLEISVQNPYDETTAIPVKGTGFGLASTRRRLFLLFARQDLLTVNSTGGQFTAVINIPQLKTDE
ncbi:MAG: histidine kinase [Ferruginibacter sp.]